MYKRSKTTKFSSWYNNLIRDTTYVTEQEQQQLDDDNDTTKKKSGGKTTADDGNDVIIEFQAPTDEGALMFYNLLAEQLAKIQIAMTIRKLDYYNIALREKIVTLTLENCKAIKSGKTLKTWLKMKCGLHPMFLKNAKASTSP